MTEDRPPPCGRRSRTGYNRHVALGERACQECADADKQYKTDYYKQVTKPHRQAAAATRRRRQENNTKRPKP